MNETGRARNPEFKAMKYLMMTFSIVIALVVGGTVVNAVQGQLHAVSQALGQAVPQPKGCC
jgi:hypothetical protein